MNKILDFAKKKKATFTVVLPDEAETRIDIYMPTKKMMEDFGAMLEDMDLDVETPTSDDVNTLYEICATLMSRNASDTAISADQLKECLDMEDIVTFITSFGDFVNELVNGKN